MAWEVRDGRRYYYRLRKVGGRVRREYVGRGPIALLAAELDRQGRAERQARRQLIRAEQERLMAADGPADELDEKADLLVRAALLATGFHRHDRGEWRRRKDGGNNKG